MQLLDVNFVAFTVLGYPLSYIELVATFFGLISVYLASRENIITWPTGVTNEFGFFLIFFQVQLYADMLLQVFFFIVTLYGWFYWGRERKYCGVSVLKSAHRRFLLLGVIVGTLLLGFLISNLHVLFPETFENPADYPFIDSFTTTASVVAMVLLARKKLESWVLWIVVDIVSIGLYWVKGIHLISLEYFVFMFIAFSGFISWRRNLVR